MNVFCIPHNFLFSFSLRFPVARKFNHNGIELSLKKTLLVAPCKLSPSRSVDKENGLPSF
jgi:hypothetical protein